MPCHGRRKLPIDLQPVAIYTKVMFNQKPIAPANHRANYPPALPHWLAPASPNAPVMAAGGGGVAMGTARADLERLLAHVPREPPLLVSADCGRCDVEEAKAAAARGTWGRVPRSLRPRPSLPPSPPFCLAAAPPFSRHQAVGCLLPVSLTEGQGEGQSRGGVAPFLTPGLSHKSPDRTQ